MGEIPFNPDTQNLDTQPKDEITYKGIAIEGLGFLESRNIAKREEIFAILDQMPEGYANLTQLGKISFDSRKHFTVARGDSVALVDEANIQPGDKVMRRARGITEWNSRIEDGRKVASDGKQSIAIYSTEDWAGENAGEVAKYALAHELGHATWSAIDLGSQLWSELQKFNLIPKFPIKTNRLKNLINAWKKLPESTLPRYVSYKPEFTQEQNREAGAKEETIENVAWQEDFAIAHEYYLYHKDLATRDPSRNDLLSVGYELLGELGKAETQPIPEPEVPQPLPETQENKKVLPFTYQRTNDTDQAQYREWRVNPVRFRGKDNPPKTDETILESIRRQREERDWVTSEYWHEKGEPTEQIEFEVGGQPITVYNFNKEIQLTDEHIEKAKAVLSKLGAHFPQILEKLRWILIDDIQNPSVFGDEEKYPLNGYALPSWKAFKFTPRGAGLISFRLPVTTNFEGVFSHEMTHLLEDQFGEEWREHFQWEYCSEHKDEWERTPVEGNEYRWVNKQTGVVAPFGEFPIQPDQCVTDYAKIKWNEDLCDSMVAYLFAPGLLKDVSPTKFEILHRHDRQQPEPTTSSRRVPKAEIQLPEIKPEIVYYYIKEPEPTKPEEEDDFEINIIDSEN